MNCCKRKPPPCLPPWRSRVYRITGNQRAHDISGVDARVHRIVDLKCPSSGESDRNLPPTSPTSAHGRGEMRDRHTRRLRLGQEQLRQLFGKCEVLFSWVNPLEAVSKRRAQARAPIIPLPAANWPRPSLPIAFLSGSNSNINTFGQPIKRRLMNPTSSSSAVRKPQRNALAEESAAGCLGARQGRCGCGRQHPRPDQASQSPPLAMRIRVSPRRPSTVHQTTARDGRCAPHPLKGNWPPGLTLSAGPNGVTTGA